MKPFALYTLPKCGTHMVMQTLACLLKPETDLFTDDLYTTVPMFNHTPQVTDLPRYFATHPDHIDYDFMEKVKDKYVLINIYRNPLDILISRYYFYYVFRGQAETVQDVFDKEFLAICKLMINHYVFIREIGGISMMYEACISNKAAMVKSLADFLGADCDEEKAAHIAAATDIKKAQESEKSKGIHKVGTVQDGPFYRDGTVNQFLKYFDEETILANLQSLPQVYKDNLTSLGYQIYSL